MCDVKIDLCADVSAIKWARVRESELAPWLPALAVSDSSVASPSTFFGGRFSDLVFSSPFSCIDTRSLCAVSYSLRVNCSNNTSPHSAKMTPSPSEAVAKVAEAAAGTKTSAKVYKRESNTARVLGAGMQSN